jgi:hypothetical protein
MMFIHTDGDVLRVGIVASTRLGSGTARVTALASFYEYLHRSGITHVLHLGGLLGSKWRPVSRHPLLDYPNTGVTTLHYPMRCPHHSQVGELMDVAGRDDWVELTEPCVDIIGPDGTVVKCHLVLDPAYTRFAALMNTWTIETGRSFREFNDARASEARASGGYREVPPTSLYLFGGGPRPAIRRNFDGACLVQSGSRFHGAHPTGAILTLPIEPGGFIRERWIGLETWCA